MINFFAKKLSLLSNCKHVSVSVKKVTITGKKIKLSFSVTPPGDVVERLLPET